MKNFFFAKSIVFCCLTLLIISCSKDELSSENILEKQHPFTEFEVEELCKIGLDASQLDVVENYIVGPMDYVINRDDLNSTAIETRHAAVGLEYVPRITHTEYAKLYIDPSYSALGLDWTNKLYGAIAYLNNIEHSRVKITLTNNQSSASTWIFADNINSNNVPLCFKNIPVPAKAEYPVNQSMGRYISVQSSSANTTMNKDKVLIHELSHTFGMQHACAPQIDTIGCTNVPVNGTQTEETFAPQYLDHCDETSVTNPLNNDIVGGTSLPVGYYPYAMQPWMNDDDIFAYQALYPITYSPFSFTIEACGIDYIYGTGISTSATLVYRYDIDFTANDFVPYQIDYELLDQYGTVVSSVTKYRYWEGFIDFTNLNVPDPTQACLKLRITLYNYKQDFTNSYTSTTCCTIN